MDVTAWLLARTPPRPMVVAVPGATATRVAVERAVLARGWRPALNPAETNILVVAGQASWLEPYLRRVWDSVPAPRVRLEIPGPFDERLLDDALAELRDPERQRAHRVEPADDLAMTVPMADRAPDRDGLTLDELHVPLGPVLPYWPAGLIVHTRLQGDVVLSATVEIAGTGADRPEAEVDAGGALVGRDQRGGDAFWLDADPAARRLDSCARLLALAGWPDQAVTAQRLRDEILDGGPAAGLGRFARRVRRSRTLRWLLAGVGPVQDGPETLAGDASTRLDGWLDDHRPLPRPDDTRWTVEHLPELLTGTELASARLVVASLDPDLELLARGGLRHG